jgi:nuclear transport factor 2 (NTF2) superfamily protein
MKLHASQKYEYRDLERGEAQLIRIGHALWRDRRKLGDTVSEREGINAALESVWQAKKEYRAELVKKKALRFSEFRKTLQQRCVAV